MCEGPPGKEPLIERKTKWIIGGTAGFLFLVVLLQNTQVVGFRFLFWEFTMSRIIFLPLLLMIGFGAGLIVGRKFRGW